MACIAQGSEQDKSMNESNILDVLNQNLQLCGLHMYILQIPKTSFILKAENRYHYNLPPSNASSCTNPLQMQDAKRITLTQWRRFARHYNMLSLAMSQPDIVLIILRL